MDERSKTKLGTPHAHTWDDVWADCVQQCEAELGRRICGAKTLAGNPCTLTSRHKTGRCAFHGGTDAIGAPVGNSNARIHGLYARRLQRCGTHCPMWQHCPFADAQVLKLDPPERPNCAYETAEYEEVLQALSAPFVDEHPHVGSHHSRGMQNVAWASSPSQLDGQATLTPNLDSRFRENDEFEFETEPHGSIRVNPPNRSNPRTDSIAPQVHNLALLQVMVSRAAAALSVVPLTDDVTSDSERYHMHTTKVHAALDAFIRLAREHRATLAQYHREQEDARKARVETAKNGYVPSLADLAAPILERADGVLEEAIAAENERRAYTELLESILTDQFGPEWKTEPGFFDSG